MKLKLALTFAALTMLTLAAACGNSSLAGDGCSVQSDCGEGLTCEGNNTFPDGGLADPGNPHLCEHVCNTDADCTGTKDHFGDTPVCSASADGANSSVCVGDVF